MIKELYSYQFFSRIVTYPMNSKFSTCKYDIDTCMQYICNMYLHVPSDSNKKKEKKRIAYLCTTVSPYLSTSKGRSSV